MIVKFKPNGQNTNYELKVFEEAWLMNGTTVKFLAALVVFQALFITYKCKRGKRGCFDKSKSDDSYQRAIEERGESSSDDKQKQGVDVE